LKRRIAANVVRNTGVRKIKNMKAKFSQVKIREKYEQVVYEITCPHCKTTLAPAPPKYVLLFECWQCNKPIYTRKKESTVHRTTAIITPLRTAYNRKRCVKLQN